MAQPKRFPEIGALAHDMGLRGGFIFWDLETIGLLPPQQKTPDTDRGCSSVGIVEISIAAVDCDGTPSWVFNKIIDPEVRIPYGASKVHGIYDKDIVGAPTFFAVAPFLRELFHGPDVLPVGFNSWSFDEPYLNAVADRYGIPPILPERQTGDLRRVWLQVSPPENNGRGRLSDHIAPVYNVSVENAHRAWGDVRTLIRTMEAMIVRHGRELVAQYLTDRSRVRPPVSVPEAKKEEVVPGDFSR